MEDIILIAILAVLVGGSAFGAIFAFIFFVWLFDRSRYEYDPNYKPKTAAELAREGRIHIRSWARVNSSSRISEKRCSGAARNVRCARDQQD